MFTDNRFGFLDRVRFGLGYATTPVYWVADIPARVSTWIDDVFVYRTDLLEENEYLREELLVAQQELQLLESLASENSRLLELNDATQVIEGEVVPAEIINISPDPYSKRVLINKGARDGVFAGQPLIDANGLMGQVDEVLPFTSWVLLITDSRALLPNFDIRLGSVINVDMHSAIESELPRSPSGRCAQRSREACRCTCCACSGTCSPPTKRPSSTSSTR